MHIETARYADGDCVVRESPSTNALSQRDRFRERAKEQKEKRGSGRRNKKLSKYISASSVFLSFSFLVSPSYSEYREPCA